VPSTLTTRFPRAAVAACGAVVLTFGLAACGSSDDSGGGSGSDTSTLNIGYTGAATPSFDPHNGATGSYQAIFPAYDTLLHVDENGDLQPWLATEWTFVDPTTLELKLRDDVTFTDGTVFDAAAVKANLEYARDIEQGTGYQTYLKGIADVQVVDPTTVRLVLAEANPGLPFDLSQNPGEMVSPKALAAPDTLAQAPAGTGPYIVDADATRQGTTLAWERNPDYWAADQDLFPYDQIVYTFGQDPTAVRNLAQAGDVDLLDLAPGDPVPTGFDSENSTSGANSGFTGIWLDVTGTNQPALKDLRVRQAINHAIDRETLAETVYEGAATPVAGVPVTEGSAAYSDELADLYAFDPDEAKSLLAEAGYADGFSMKLLALPVAESFAQAIAGNLRDVGIDAEITSVAGPDLPKQLFTGTYDAGLLLQRPTGQPGQDIAGLFSPNAFYNVHKAEDPQIAEQLGAAAAATDEGARDTAYQDTALYAADQSWFAATLLVENISAFKSDVVTVTPPPFGEIFLYHLNSAS
jgi:peptide/nickel transport system substrate-binding protein